MATTTYYVDFASGAPGTGTVLSPFNSVSQMNSVAGVIANGDEVVFNITGSGNVSAVSLLTAGWAGDGGSNCKLTIVGNQPSGALYDATKATLLLIGSSQPLVVSMAGGLKTEFRGVGLIANYSAVSSLLTYTPAVNGALTITNCPIRHAAFSGTNVDLIRALTTNTYVHNITITDTSVGDGFDEILYCNYMQGLVANINKLTAYSLSSATPFNCHANATVSVTNSAVSGLTSVGNVDTFSHNATSSGLGTNAVTVTDWAAQFVDAANGNFTLASGSALTGAGQSGINIGAYQAAPYIQSVTPASIDEGGTVTIEIRDASSAPTTVAMVTGNASVSRSLTQTIFSGGTYIGTFTAPASVDAVDIRPGSYSLSVTVGATNLSQSGLTLTCDAGQSYLQMGTPNTTSDYRLQSTPTFISGDYIVFGYWHNASDVSQGIYPEIDADGVVHYPDGWESGWYFVWKLWDSEETTTGEFWGAEATYTVVSNSDTTADAFVFLDVTGASQSTAYISNAITVSGMSAGAEATAAVSGGAMSVSTDNGVTWGAFSGADQPVQNGHQVRVRVTSSASPLTAVSAMLSIGGVSDTFTVMTASGAGTVTVDAGSIKDSAGAPDTNTYAHWMLTSSPDIDAALKSGVVPVPVASGTGLAVTNGGCSISLFGVPAGAYLLMAWSGESGNIKTRRFRLPVTVVVG